MLEAYNNYELLLDLCQGKKLIVFKDVIVSINFEEKPPNDKSDIERW